MSRQYDELAGIPNLLEQAIIFPISHSAGCFMPIMQNINEEQFENSSPKNKQVAISLAFILFVIKFVQI